MPEIDHRYLDHLSQAIRIPTVSHDDPARIDVTTFGRFRDWLEATYPRIFTDLDVETVGGHTPVIEWPGTDPGLPAGLLLAHQDVVPVEPGTEAHWEHDPFSGVREGGYVWGRGALDMKGALVAILEAVERMLEEGRRPDRTVIVVLGHDEEIGGLAGARAAAEALPRRGIRPWFVLDEGGFVTRGLLPGLRSPTALIGIAEKGYLSIELSVEAEGGHAAAPPRHTAIGLLAGAIRRLESRRLPARLELVAPLLEAVAAQSPAPVRHAYRMAGKVSPLAGRLLASRPETDALIRTTGAVTVVEGGSKVNALPARARAIANFRILPGDTVDTVLSHVRSAVGSGVSVRPIDDQVTCDPPGLADTSSEVYAGIAAGVREVDARAIIAPWVLVAMTDSRHFRHLTDDVYRFTPFHVDREELSRYHGRGERIRESDGAAAVGFYRGVIERLCG